ncbi:MAG: hypothetical protein Q9224_004556 [Gallowayella concinna]
MPVVADPKYSNPPITPAINSQPTVPPTNLTTHTQTMSSSLTAPASTKMPTPAADNLHSALSFRSKKKPPRNVVYFHPQTAIGPQPSQAPVLQHAQQTAETPPQQEAAQVPNPMTTFADPVRYITWGPKTVYYTANLPKDDDGSSKSSKKEKKKKKRDARSGKAKKGNVMFEKVILNGSEQMQTTEKTEVLNPDQGGGIKRTWVCVTRTEVVSFEKEIEDKDVVVESESEESSDGDCSESEDECEDDKILKDVKGLQKKKQVEMVKEGAEDGKK